MSARQAQLSPRSVAWLLAVSLLLVHEPLEAQDTRLQTAVAGLQFREIGPAIMGGRIADLAIVESKTRIFYVATASGGVWKTTDRGTTFEPIFDDQSTGSIGDVTVSQTNPNLVWVGTGEPQNRQSSPWGDGAFKSTDGGRTWQHVGLRDTKHIGRIVIHPANPDIVYVAAVGHLWGPNPERGVYRTTDGGATWERVLFVDENTGAIDLAMDPDDPQTLFAAMYQRRRTGFGFNGGGPGSGIYRTTDGGASWQELTNGLPEGNLGRIGLDIYRHDGNLVYAVVEADLRTGGGGGFGPPGQGGPRKSGVFRSRDRGDTWEKLSDTNPRPMYYSQIRIDPNDPDRIYVLGTQLAVSEDGGKTFRNDGAPGIHVDHHALWIDPTDSDHLILGSDGGVSRSYDRGVSWRKYDNLAIGQVYQVGVDMRDPYYVCGGLQDNSPWCGPSRTLNSYGIRNADWYDVWGGDGFFSVPDPNDSTTVYSESQGGNLGRYDVITGERTQLKPVARPTDDDEDRRFRWNWNTPIVVSSHNSATVYVGANVVLKTTDRGMHWEEISPDLTKQLDRDELEIMGVLPTDGMISRHDGISSYGNITTIGESPVNPDVLYAGTDDGNVQVTRDGGATWEDITSRVEHLPERTYVSRIVPSRFDEGTVYATFDGHRNDDYRPYVYVSRDYGRRWRAITSGLPDWSVNVVVEHRRNPNLLFVGNEIGVYFSIDGGERWTRLQNNLPTVPVDDIVIHPRENDLVLGTHGRSVWILPDITPLEQMSSEVLASAAHLFPTKRATMYSIAGGWPFNAGRFAAANPPNGAVIRYYLGRALGPAVVTDDVEVSGPNARESSPQQEAEHGAKISILDAGGEVVRELDGPGGAGIQQVVWDFRREAPPQPEGGQRAGGGFGGTPRGPLVAPGTYTVRLEAAGETATTDLVVRLDPRVEISRPDLMARQEALAGLADLSRAIGDANRAMRTLNQQVTAIRNQLRDHKDAPDDLVRDVDSLEQRLEELGQEISTAGRDTRLSGAIEGATAPPTEDQLWQIERAWERVPALVERLNEIITITMPAINHRLDDAGIRPDPGEPIVIPRRSRRSPR
jgi:photosystem II stability/assembly factor-like uncharacterized protein